jgi:hypothetical protein
VYPRRNNNKPPTVEPLLRWLAWLSLAVAGLAHAQQFANAPVRVPVEPDPGRFEIRSASTELRAGVYYLNAAIAYRLSSEARNALQSGVPLTIRLDVEVINSRRFWFDNDVASLRQRYQLEYHALSERYIVVNLNSGDQRSFASLFAALASLGRVEELPLLDAALLPPDHEYYMRLRAVLDVEQLPGPLRLLAFWRRDYSIGSGWYRWRLRNH